MSHRQRSAVVALLLVAVLLVAGCAPRPGAGDVLSQAGEGEIVVDLPAMVIDYDLEGQPSVGGVPLSSLGMLPASVVEQITLDADIIGQLQDANIQNLQVNNQTSGLTLFVNGAQIPSLSWDKDSLATLASLHADVHAAGNSPATAHTLAGRTEGVNLDDKGLGQAAELVERLAGMPIKALVRSPLLRCRRLEAGYGASRVLFGLDFDIRAGAHNKK